MFLFYIHIFVILFITCTYSCPTGWMQDPTYPTICYFFGNNPLQWQNASTFCLNIAPGATLPIFYSFSEYSSYHNIIKSSGQMLCSDITWLGLTFNITSNVSSWVDNQVLSFNGLWATGQPSNNGKCVQHFAWGGFWMTTSCNVTGGGYKFYCQLRTNETTTVVPQTTQYVAQVDKNCSTCPNGWTKDDSGICYFYVDKITTDWYSAKNYCSNIMVGASLPIFRSPSESFTYSTFLEQLLVPCVYYQWLSMTDSAQEGSFLWTDNNLPTFFQWAQQAPSNSTAQNCVASSGWLTPSSSWTDTFCARPLSFACQLRFLSETNCSQTTSTQLSSTSTVPSTDVSSTDTSSTSPLSSTDISTTDTSSTSTVSSTDVPSTETSSTETDVSSTETISTSTIPSTDVSPTDTPLTFTISSTDVPLTDKSSISVIPATGVSPTDTSLTYALSSTSSTDASSTSDVSSTDVSSTDASSNLSTLEIFAVTSMAASSSIPIFATDSVAISTLKRSSLMKNLFTSSGKLLAANSTSSTPISNFSKLLQTIGIRSGVQSDFLSTVSTVQDAIPFLTATLNDSVKMAIGHQFNEMVISCSYSSDSCDNIDNFKQSCNPMLGNCFTFNSGTEAKYYVTRAGTPYGLRLVLYASQSDYMCTSLQAGFKVAIDENNLQSFPDSEGYYVTPGTVTYFNIRQVHMGRLSSPYGICADPNFGGFNGTYTVQACQRQCYQNYVLESCKCADPRYELPSGTNYCLIDKKICLDFSQTCEDDIITSTCNCPPRCSESVFQVSITTATFRADDLQGTLCDGVVNQSDCMKSFRSGFALVYMFYDSLNYFSYVEEPAYPMMNLLGDFSGVTGLLIGLCAMSLFEFAMFAYLIAFGYVEKLLK